MRPAPRQLRPRPPVAAAAGIERASLARWAELAVADYLFASGFSILGRNVRLGSLELDVVARKENLVVVVEVRARRHGAMVGPFESVSRAKRAHLRRAAERLWRERIRAMTGVTRVRIDVAAVHVREGKTGVEYVEGAVSWI